MHPGLEIEYQLDEEPAKIRVFAAGEGVAARAECYVHYGKLKEFAQSFASFPSQPQDTRSFGQASEAKSFCVMQFTLEDSHGHVLVTINYANGDYEPYRSEGTIRFQSDLSSLDSFATLLLTAIENKHGIATLAGIR